MRPVLGLGNWPAFAEHGGITKVIGDLVLTQPEVNPVLRRLHAGGLTATALHNHRLRGTPATMYMHVHGHGDAVALARALRTALEASATPVGPSVPAAAAPDVNTAPLDRIIGTAGKVNDGAWQAVLPRPERIMKQGCRPRPT